MKMQLFLSKTGLTADPSKIISLYYHKFRKLMFVRLPIFLRHIIVFSVPIITEYLYQQFDANGTSISLVDGNANTSLEMLSLLKLNAQVHRTMADWRQSKKV